ncbi:MAG TPA: hypothetical protein VFX22_05165 [Candidatus Kapabacteria bacterium]|nr:hypothetical protein [Candidatus Kapabacteria bacterium]
MYEEFLDPFFIQDADEDELAAPDEEDEEDLEDEEEEIDPLEEDK